MLAHAAARSFGPGQGARRENIRSGLGPASDNAMRQKARRREGCSEEDLWLRCSSLTDRCEYLPSSRLARDPPLSNDRRN